MSELDEIAENIIRRRAGSDLAILRVDSLDDARRIVVQEMPGETSQVVDGVASSLLAQLRLFEPPVTTSARGSML